MLLREGRCVICGQVMYDPLLKEIKEDADEEIKKLAQSILMEALDLLSQKGFMDVGEATRLIEEDKDSVEEITAMIIMQLMPEEG